MTWTDEDSAALASRLIDERDSIIVEDANIDGEEAGNGIPTRLPKAGPTRRGITRARSRLADLD